MADDLNGAIMTTNAADALGFCGPGAYAEARSLAQAAVEEKRAYGYFAALIHSLCTLESPVVDVQPETYSRVRVAMHEADRGSGTPLGRTIFRSAHTVCALIASAYREDALAAALIGASDAVDARKAMPTQPLERIRRAPAERDVREPDVGEAAYTVAVARGKSMSDEEIVAETTRFLESASMRREQRYAAA